MARLFVKYEPENDWHGELHATVTSNGFEGRSSAWFKLHDLRMFADALRAYPLDAAPCLAGGYWGEKGDEPEQVHLSFRISTKDSLGSLLATVHLATPFERGEDADLFQQVAARFVTSYSELGEFAEQLAAVLEGRLDAAQLNGAAF